MSKGISINDFEKSRVINDLKVCSFLIEDIYNKYICAHSHLHDDIMFLLEDFIEITLAVQLTTKDIEKGKIELREKLEEV